MTHYEKGWHELQAWWSAGQHNIEPNAFTSRSILSAEQCNNNIEHEALGIQHRLEKFHHYCFVKQACIINDLKLLVAILSKDVAMLSQLLQYSMLKIQQCRMHIICKPGPNLCIVEWLSWNNHTENKDQEITGIGINVSAISMSVNMSVCMSTEDILIATQEDTHL